MLDREHRLRVPPSAYVPYVPFITSSDGRHVATARVVDHSKVGTDWAVTDFAERHAKELHRVADDRTRRRHEVAEVERRLAIKSANYYHEQTATPTQKVVPSVGQNTPRGGAQPSSKSDYHPSLWVRMAEHARGNTNDPQFWAPREQRIDATTLRWSDHAAETARLRDDPTEGDVMDPLLAAENAEGIKRRLLSKNTTTVLAREDPRPPEEGVNRSVATETSTPVERLLISLIDMSLRRAVRVSSDAPQQPPPPLAQLLSNGATYPNLIARAWGTSSTSGTELERLLASVYPMLHCADDGNLIQRYLTIEPLDVGAVLDHRRPLNHNIRVNATPVFRGLRYFVSVYGTRDVHRTPPLARFALDQLVDVTLGVALAPSMFPRLRSSADAASSASLRSDRAAQDAMSAAVLKFVSQHQPKAPTQHMTPEEQKVHRDQFRAFSTALESQYPGLIGPITSFQERAMLPSRNVITLTFLSDDVQHAVALHFMATDEAAAAGWIASLRQLLVLNDTDRVASSLGVSVPPVPNGRKPTPDVKSLNSRRWLAHCLTVAEGRKATPRSGPQTVGGIGVKEALHNVFKDMFLDGKRAGDPAADAIV